MDGDSEKFYSDAKSYWENVPATLDGMLGGFSHISPTDISGSKVFLRPFLNITGGKTKNHRVVDCGSGIGRITKRLLLPLFQTVDMVELNEAFLDKARQFIGVESKRVDKLICCGLQDFTPEPQRYDVIWCQWVLGHLTDKDFVLFFQRCKSGLAPDGIIIVKENTISRKDKDFDELDSSYTRPACELKDLFTKSELTIIKEEKQKGFPKDIYDVYMYALR